MRFYAELQDCLPATRNGHRPGGFDHTFSGQVSVKDMVESLGVPHTEVDLILANGDSVDFSYRVRDGDRISVYPRFESIDVEPILRVRPRPLPEFRFVLDVHLGKLASFLRLLGLDSLYRSDFADESLARLSSAERRILLTRDRGLLKRSQVIYGYWIRETNPRLQLIEVVRRFGLWDKLEPFGRCLRCNGEIESIPGDEVASRLLPRTREHYRDFRWCPKCERVYWKGSHHDRMQGFLEEVVASAQPGRSFRGNSPDGQ
ncbi:MAG: twitching motility protein PilT [Acidobacteriota bacterium]|nr:twitching motility protein PilT [Acidobacteriota bacterium]